MGRVREGGRGRGLRAGEGGRRGNCCAGQPESITAPTWKSMEAPMVTNSSGSHTQFQKIAMKRSTAGGGEGSSVCVQARWTGAAAQGCSRQPLRAPQLQLTARPPPPARPSPGSLSGEKSRERPREPQRGTPFSQALEATRPVKSAPSAPPGVVRGVVGVGGVGVGRLLVACEGGPAAAGAGEWRRRGGQPHLTKPARHTAAAAELFKSSTHPTAGSSIRGRT